jgi:acyl-ACP thioesterase
VDVWEERFTVKLADVDGFNKLKPSALFGFFQQATALHGDDLGIGVRKVAESGQGWMLSRFSVELKRRPAMSEKLTLKTWPRGFKRLFAIRDYLITDESGANVAEGRSGWLVIDLKKRRPLREESLCLKLPLNSDMPDMVPDGLAALTAIDGAQMVCEKTPGYSDGDYNGHVNNVRYIEWLQDIVFLEAPEDGAGFDVLRIDINYINEIIPGEKALLYKTSVGDSDFVEARRLCDSQCVFRASLLRKA